MLLCACSSTPEPIPDTQFTYMPVSHTSVAFQNLAEESLDRNISDYDYFYNGAGVAVCDLDGDLLPEIFFAGNDVDNRLYRNKGNFEFEDVTKSAGVSGPGWATGVCMVDINGDNLLDIYVCYAGPDHRKSMPVNKLFVNLGGLEFEESAAEYGLDIRGLSIHSVFFDADEDGDSDCLVLKHAPRSLGNQFDQWIKTYSGLRPNMQENFESVFLRNNEGVFSPDLTAFKHGWGFGLGAAVSDFNDDNRPDIYIANDYFIEDKYFFNTSTGFEKQTWGPVAHTSYYSMGCDASDINNDGLSDLVVLDMTPADHYRSKMMMSSMQPEEFSLLVGMLGQTPQYMINTLQLNTGKGNMSEIAQVAGVDKTDWSWAPLLADFDNDGFKDLYVTNGVKRDVENNDWRLELRDLREQESFDDEIYFQHLLKAPTTALRNAFYRNTNGIQFQEKAEEYGLMEHTFSHGAAYGDLDQDGDLDLVVNNLGQEANVIRNNANHHNENHFVRIRLLDVDGRDYQGYARVSLSCEKEVFVLENQFSRGYMSYCEPVLHFGIGAYDKVEWVKVECGTEGEVVEINPGIDQLHEIRIKNPKKSSQDIVRAGAMNPGLIKSRVVHKNPLVNDFEAEILLPHRMSQLGPGACLIDFNRDGRDDIFVGGGANQSSRLLKQNEDGTFSLQRSEAFREFRNRQVLGAKAFDANGDGAQDIYIAYGGLLNQPAMWQDVLFLNDGEGQFRASEWLPPLESSTRTIAPCDFDGDGDIDLFIGGRNTPGSYPVSPRSYLLENTGIQFRDITPDVLQFPGMVTDAKWHDPDQDGQMDLLLVGEWMKPTWIIQDSGAWEVQHVEGLEKMYGWWNCVELHDLNDDGRPEIIAGNLGWNNKFHPTIETPLLCYYGDVDENGSLDILLAKSKEGSVLPVRGLECSSAQVPGLEATIEDFNQFASGTMSDIYGDQSLAAMEFLQVTEFSSGIFWSDGEGYRFEPFPLAAQFAPINDFVIDDFSGDGRTDILYAGNNSLTEVETVAYDASKGGILFGTANNEFHVSHLIETTGLYAPGNVRELLWIERGKHGNALIIVNNNAPVQVWTPD